MRIENILKTLLLGSLVLLFSQTVTAHEKWKEKDKESTSGATLAYHFIVSPGDNLVVDITGDIYIKTWDKSEIQIDSQGMDEYSQLVTNQSGHLVTIRSRGSEVELHVTVPSKLSLDMETDSGEIDMRGVFAGKISAATGGGDIQLDSTTGDVLLRTSGGGIYTKDIDGNAVLKSGGGEIEVGRVTGTLEVGTGGGDVTVKDVIKTLRASTGGGNIDVANVGSTAEISTGGGDVTVRNVHGQVEISTGGGSITAGKVDGSVKLSTGGGDITLAGASGTISASSGGGDIHMDDVKGSVEARTAGGDIITKMYPSGTGQSTFKSSGGEITLYVPESAKVTIDAIIRVHGRWESHVNDCGITSDFKATSYDKSEAERQIHAVYSLNGGGEQIFLDTVNSNITIHALK